MQGASFLEIVYAEKRSPNAGEQRPSSASQVGKRQHGLSTSSQDMTLLLLQH